MSLKTILFVLFLGIGAPIAIFFLTQLLEPPNPDSFDARSTTQQTERSLREEKERSVPEPTSKSTSTPTPAPAPPSSSTPTPTPQLADVDLDVAYIERTPKYDRYRVCYQPPGYNPSLCTDQSPGEQRWPAQGQIVTFSAKVINKGSKTSPAFSYIWFLDAQAVASGIGEALAPGSSKTFSYQWTWKNGDHSIGFFADSENQVKETSKLNNLRTDAANALAYRIHVESTVYNNFNALLNMRGTRSFEDWIQAHVDSLNTFFAQSGTQEAVRIDEVVVEADSTLPRGGEHAPEDIAWDGRWGFETNEWSQSKIQNEVGGIQTALLHELTHQLGVIDSYNLNYDWNYAAQNKVIPGCSLFAGIKQGYEQCVYYNQNLAGIMTGAYSQGYSSFALKALNSNAGKRRGYFGEYLYDIPRINTVQFLDAGGLPLKNAEVAFYQDSNCNEMPDNAQFSGTTDSAGFFLLPNRDAENITTETGHTLRENPFGNINIVGCNGIFLVKITAKAQVDYQWMDISMFNLAYWSGNTQEAIYTVETDIQ